MHQYQFVAAAASPKTDDLASSEILSIKRIQYPNWLPAKLTPYCFQGIGLGGWRHMTNATILAFVRPRGAA